MADKKVKNTSIEFAPEEIMGMEISKSGEYKYARVGVKKGENERMSVYYEWMGAGIPDFVMSLMGHMQANKEEIEARINNLKDEYIEFKTRV